VIRAGNVKETLLYLQATPFSATHEEEEKEMMTHLPKVLSRSLNWFDIPLSEEQHAS
jgi:hypothetical protein